MNVIQEIGNFFLKGYFMPVIPESVEISEQRRTRVYVFLTRLRVSGNAPNMMDSWKDVMRAFSIPKRDSQRLAIDWMEWFENQPEHVIEAIENEDPEVNIVVN
tara:strand:- start:139 stop:447 length:309 start_codon:yes stop_codon:yes gene_type:complete